jgi:uncharacterized coiled-coil DUF342 family protein
MRKQIYWEEPAVILKDIWEIVSEIEEAKRINNNIMLFSEEAFTVHNSSKLSDAISKLQIYSSQLRSECIKLLKAKNDLEKKLNEVHPDISATTIYRDINRPSV